MADNRVEEAIAIVARRIIADIVERAHAIGEVSEQWENHPLIGERDWNKVVDQVEWHVQDLNIDQTRYEAAYEFLARRAGEENDEGSQGTGDG